MEQQLRRTFPINELSTLLFTAGGIHGENIQNFPEQINKYHPWVVGHLSDLCGGAMLTSFLLMLIGNRRVQKGIPLAVCGLLTLDEYTHLLNPDNKVTDFQDVLCYVAGAYVAYGSSRFLERAFRTFDYSFLERVVPERF